jgi:hypothetical protein
LFKYIDKTGTGEIGYDEFTLLLEERWRGMDPVDAIRANLMKRRNSDQNYESYKP